MLPEFHTFRMKEKLYILFILIGSCFLGMSQSSNDSFQHKTLIPDSLYPSPEMVVSYQTDWTKAHYPKRIVEFKNFPLKNNDIVFIGNSITEQAGDWGSLFNSDRIINRGISGDVTEGVLNRLNEIYYFKPSAVFILIGINDLYLDKTPEFIANNIFEIVKGIRENSPSTKIYVRTILPTTNIKLITKIRETNSLLLSGSASNSYALINLYEVFADKKHRLIKEYNTDGLHLSQEGYQKWVNHEKLIIDSLVKSIEPVHNQIYYVSPTGSDQNDGSLNSPWATITYGATHLEPADTLIVKTGKYLQQALISSSGSKEKYITIKGEEGSFIEGSPADTKKSMLTVKDANFVIVDGITVKNAKTHGIKVQGKCKNIVIRNCRTEHTDGCGILVQGSYGHTWDKEYHISDIIIENNEIHWPQEGSFNGNLLWHEDITLMYGVENFEIRNNYINAYDTVNYHGGPIGIDVKDGVRYGSIHHNKIENIPSTGIYIDAWDSYVHHIDIFQNYVHNVTAYGIQIGAERGGPIDSVKVYNNTISNVGWCGIISGDFTGGDEPSPQPKTHIDIFNNTIYESGLRGWGTSIRTQSSFKKGKIYNNVMYNCKTNGLSVNTADSNLITNNCIYRNTGDKGDYGENFILDNPRFVNEKLGNFNLKKTSPCIDAGAKEGAINFDFKGFVIPVGKGYDMGAHEYRPTVSDSSIVLQELKFTGDEIKVSKDSSPNKL